MNAYRTILVIPLLFVFHCGGRSELLDGPIAPQDAGTDAPVVHSHPPHVDARAPACPSPRPTAICIDDCWSDAQNQTDPVCNDVEWTCPAGFFFDTECTDGECAYQPIECCDLCGNYIETICGGPGPVDCGPGEQICESDTPSCDDGGFEDDDDFEDASGR